MILYRLAYIYFCFEESFIKAIHIISAKNQIPLGNLVINFRNRYSAGIGESRFGQLRISVMMRMAKSVLYLFEELQILGMTKKNSCDFVGEVVWEISKNIGTPLLNSVPRFIAKSQKIVWINTLLWNTIWGKPFIRSNVISNGSTYSFDVLQCPMSEYFKVHNETDLCAKAFCEADFKLAALWGFEFSRQQTLASGCSHCDFRFFHE